MNRIYFRLYQFCLKLFVLIYPFPRPKLFVGLQGLERCLTDLSKNKHIFIVSDKTIEELGLLNDVLKSCEQQGLDYTIYTDVEPNPSIESVEQGLTLYLDNKCDSILAVGGGSVMDCAKLIGARVARPSKSIQKLKGLFKIIKPIPPLYAIPTTAGTGSETTIVAVVSDKQNQQKYAVTDLVLAPKAAILLPEITTGLPPHITATTGMDALTHAIESYIGVNSTPFTRKRSLKAIKLIFENLEVAFENGEDLSARENMLLASFYAGEAFTRASVGYVHAIAHQFGALYNTPHGLANAILLPKLLNFYAASIENKMKEIAQYCDIDIKPNQTASLVVYEKIISMNEKMAIPTTLAAVKERDFKIIAQMAYTEAHPDYPVPKFMTVSDIEEILAQTKPR